MKAAGLDAPLILTRGENIFYASGFRASHFASWLSELHALIVPVNGEPRLMTRALEREIAKLQWTGSPQLYLDHENPYELLVKILRESGNDTKTIGIEERFLKVSQLRRIQQHLPAPSSSMHPVWSKVSRPARRKPSPTACAGRRASPTSASRPGFARSGKGFIRTR